MPIALADHYALGTTTTADLLRIERTDGQVYLFTSSSDDVPYDGEIYSAEQGLKITSILHTIGLGVDNLELTTLDDGSVFTSDDVRSGIWRNAEFLITRVNYRSPTSGVEDRLGGTIGNVELRRGYVVVELFGWQMWANQTIGSVSSKDCRARLGDANCRKDLTSFTHTATITSVSTNQVFAASSLAQADDYFGNGVLTWTSGPSDGTSHQVKTHVAGGVLTLMVPMLLTVEVGHTLSIVAGCRKRHERTAANPGGVSDCIDKFNNIPNFYGEPHLPGTDALTSPP